LPRAGGRLDDNYDRTISMEAQSGSLRIERREDVIHIELARPVVDEGVTHELYELIGDLEDDSSIRPLVFRLGRGGFRRGPFGRLAPSIAELGPDDGLAVFTHLEKVLVTLERLPRATVAVLDGPMGSFALELALVADLTIATPNTVFYVQGPERGFLPGMSLYRLARHVGLGAARHIVLHQPMITARQAQHLDIVDRVVRPPDPALRGELSHLLAVPPQTLTFARQMLSEAGPMSYQQAYDSYKAAQFHALHGLTDDTARDDPKAPLSAAEYVLEPLREWIATASDAVARGWSRLATDAPAVHDSSADGVLRRLDCAGIDGAVLYPTALFSAYQQLAGAPLMALLRRYNDWVVDLCAGAPDRLRAAVLLDVDEPEAAAAEASRTAGGAAAAVIPLFPHTDQRYDSQRYEPLWRTLEELGYVITFHRRTCRSVGADSRPFDVALHRVDDEDPTFDQVFDVLEGSYARLAVVAMILSGVFDRHPDLRVVTVGFGLAWAAYALLRLDEQYEVRPERVGPPEVALDGTDRLESPLFAPEGVGYHVPEGQQPSDHFRRHVFVAVDDDPLGLELTSVFGAANILWAGQQDPLMVGEPSARRIARVRAGLSTEERTTIERRNAAFLYRFGS
jgi:enoyl-CoA hydratase/carnithine racemase/predicted TIM-barrel fold metal-dependent hydrolase